ncbi:hypothetical protein ACDA63_18190 [Uliginosibacterium sp. sgz301328]|uniref:hypothetical protein n=1 Tax=Uliginosibacterium sp. sgz301328 TaxID=3243764 RepID=UPI00359E1DD7
MTWHAERGYAALAMVAILGTASAVILVRGFARGNERPDMREARWTQIALREAQAALVGKAALEDNTPGALVCPDTTTSATSSPGEANSCGDALNGETLGCVPWKTLGIPSAERYGISPLWYALSADLRSASYSANGRTTASRQINPLNKGQLQIVTTSDGSITPALAALIAPGRALNGQNRDSPSCDPTQASNYLDIASTTPAGSISNADRSGKIVRATATDQFNDTVLPLNRDDLMRFVAPVVLQALNATAPALNGRLPASGQTLASARGGTLAAQATFDDALWAIWPAGTALGDAAEPAACGSGILENISYACAGVRVDDNGVSTNVQCFTPASGPRTPASWLCFNRWYEFVRYDAAGAGGFGALSIDYGAATCSLELGATGSSPRCTGFNNETTLP